MKIRTGDKVKVIAGKDKGKQGNIVKIFTKAEKVIVEGVNIMSRHVKPTKTTEGGIMKAERPIHISNVMLVDNDKATRVGYKIVDGKKHRLAKKSGEVIKGKTK